MRILHVIAEMSPGGAERIVVDLAAEAVADGDEVAVASSGGAWVERLEAAGATHHRIALPRRRLLSAALAASQLRGVLARFRPDVVHAHNVGMAVAVAAARQLVGDRPPMVTTLHGVDPADLPRATRLLKRTRAPVVACGPAVGRELVAAGFPADRLRVIVNGAGLEPATAERVAAMKGAVGVDGDRPLLVGIGRLVAQKGWADTVELAARLGSVTVVVAGEGPLRDELVAMADERGADVRFVGTVDDVPALLGMATCLVSTSNWEGLPLVLLEALSVGVPVVAYGLDGIAEIVPRDAAVLVPPGDLDAAGRAVAGLVSDPERAAALGRRALTAAAGWSPEAMRASYRQLHRELARRSSTAGSPGSRRWAGRRRAPS